MASFGFIIFITAVLTGLGWLLVGRLGANGRLSGSETAAFAFATGSLILYFAVFLIGPYRLDGISMWGLTATFTIVAAFSIQKEALGQLLGQAKDLPALARTHPWSACLWIAIVLVGSSSLIQGMAPPNDYDGLMYHLSFPRRDVENGFISIPFDRGLGHAFFPQLGGNISRFALATMNVGVAQMMHGLYGLLAAAATGLIMRRVGYGRDLALSAALLFLVSRVVIWEMGSSETDVPLAAFAALAMLAYLSFRQDGSPQLMVLFGLMIGGGILFKLIGFVVAVSFAPLIFADLANTNRRRLFLMVGPAVALFVVTPHLIATYAGAGNPFYPLFSSIFNPEAQDPFRGVSDAFGTGRGVIDFIMAPWTIFTMPMHYYDGMVFGAPYLLALAPLAFVQKGSWATWRAVLSFMLVFFAFWFWGFGQQTRFLLPLVPFTSCLAAVGLGALWQMSSGRRGARFIVVGIIGVLAINQALFVGIYTLLRIPPAIGLMTAQDYHTRTPTLGGAFFETCTYIDNNLKPGEKYLSVTGAFHSYYCPQAPVVYNYFPDEAQWWLKKKEPPGMDAAEFLKRFEQWNFRYVIVSWASESRRDPEQIAGHKARKNLSAKPKILLSDGSDSRFSDYLDPVLDGLDPLIKGSMTAVYDGPAVLEALRRQLQP
ncbi:MAG: glycosyltransferase family 39 protein [Rhodospirillales bacterium]|nr:glycosyltransferase family 39 protein [Rhodospirillales bacterium]